MSMITWNMQGGTAQAENKWNTGVVSLFNQHGARVVFLQECGGVPGSAIPDPQFQLQGANLSFSYWHPGPFLSILHWQNPAVMQSLAIVWDTMNPPGNPQGGALFPVAGGRPVLSLTTDDPVMGVRRFCSVHANAPLNGGVANGMAILNSITPAVGTTDFVAGDWNTVPGGWVGLPLGWAIWPPDGITQHNINNPQNQGFDIDYIITNALQPPVVGTRIQLTVNQFFNIFSDHCPVRYT